MSEETQMAFKREGSNAFDLDEKENEDSSSSSEVNTEDTEEKETKTDTTQTSEGDENTQDDTDKDVPFHKHPRWNKREKDWDERFNNQETRHAEDMAKITEQFSKSNKDSEEQEIPEWFGGDERQLAAYRADQKKEKDDLKKSIIESFNKDRDTKEQSIKESNDYMKSEILSIQDDSKLNPDKLKVDQNKLLKVVDDFKLVDIDGKWNYRAGWEILKAKSSKKTDNTNKDRKDIAGALNSGSKPENKQVAYKTNKDFKTDKPW